MSAGSGWPSPFAFPDATEFSQLPSPLPSAWQTQDPALLGSAGLTGTDVNGSVAGAGDMDVIEEDGMSGTVILGRRSDISYHESGSAHPEQQQEQQQAARPLSQPAAVAAGEEEDDDDPVGDGESDASSNKSSLARRQRTSASAAPERSTQGRSRSRSSRRSAGPISSPERDRDQPSGSSNRRASTLGPDENGKRKKRSRPSTGRAPGRPKDDLISKLAVMREDTGRLHCIAERCTQTWSSRTPLRIKHHASLCPHLPSSIRTLATNAYRHAMNKAAERKAAKEGISFVDSDDDVGGGGGAGALSDGREEGGRMEVDPERQERHRPKSAGPSTSHAASIGSRPPVPAPAPPPPSSAPPAAQRTEPAPPLFSPVPFPTTHQSHPQQQQPSLHQQQPTIHPAQIAAAQGGDFSMNLPTFPLPSFETQPNYAHGLPPPSSMQHGAVTSPAASISAHSSGSSGSLGGILNHFAPVSHRYPSLGPSFLPSNSSSRHLFKSASNPPAAGSSLGGPSPPAFKISPPKTTNQKPLWRLVASKLFNAADQSWMHDKVLTVDTTTGLIVSVRGIESFGLAPDSDDVAVLEGVPSMDVRGLTIVPGFIDAHVHLLLHSYQEAPWQQQVLNESIVERTVRAVGHARKTLKAGYTTVRDLGSEGALDADIHLKQSLSPPLSLAPSPRIFVSSRAIVSTGSYGPRTQKWDDPGHEEVGCIVGAEVADGPDEIRKVVRRQLGRGADWIKIYADYPTRSTLTPFSPRLASAGNQVFSFVELKAAVDTAAAAGVKVAAHATRADTIRDCVNAGVATIEHGYDADRRAFELMKEYGVIWIPTLSAYAQSVTLMEHRSSNAQATFNLTGSPQSEALLRQELKELRLAEDRWQRMKRAFKLGLEIGVKMACGGDTGVFAHGENANEMQRMVSLGAPVMSVLAWCTQGGWEAVRPRIFDGTAGAAHLAKWSTFAQERSATLSSNLNSQPNWFVPLGPKEAGEHEQPLGRIEVGFAADLVGLAGDVEAHFGAAVTSTAIKLVIKGAKVVQLDGDEVATDRA